MAKIDILFMTKTAEKPYPLGPHIPIYIAHVTEYRGKGIAYIQPDCPVLRHRILCRCVASVMTAPN